MSREKGMVIKRGILSKSSGTTGNITTSKNGTIQISKESSNITTGNVAKTRNNLK